MSATVDIRPMPGYTHATVTGEFDVESTKEAITRILSAAHAHPTSKILIDCRGYKGNPSLGERFSIVTHILELRIKSMLHGQPSRYQTVLVARPPLVHPARYGLRMLVERNLRITICGTLDEALAWLGIAAVQTTSPTGGD